VDPVTDPLLLRKSGSAGNRTRTSGSVARSLYLLQIQKHIIVKLIPLHISHIIMGGLKAETSVHLIKNFVLCHV
jgi:hypothetical protein